MWASQSGFPFSAIPLLSATRPLRRLLSTPRRPRPSSMPQRPRLFTTRPLQRLSFTPRLPFITRQPLSMLGRASLWEALFTDILATVIADKL
jgi:hypothetical protein